MYIQSQPFLPQVTTTLTPNTNIHVTLNIPFLCNLWSRMYECRVIKRICLL